MPPRQLTDSLDETLDLFDVGGAPLTTTEVAASLDLGRRSTYDRLDRLVEREQLETKKVGASARVWWRPPSTADADDPGPTGWPTDVETVVDTVLDTADIAVLILDADLDVVWDNETAERYFGRGRGRLLGADQGVPRTEGDGGWPVIDGVDGDPVASGEQLSREVVRTGEPVLDRRWELTYPDGDRRWVSVNAAPIVGADGDVGHVVVTAEDVSELTAQARKLERQRDELASELEDVFDRITDGFYGLDQELRFTFVNERAEALLGLDRAAAIGEDLREHLPLTDRFERALDEALEHREPMFVEDYYEPLDGWYEHALYPSETGVSVYFRDVTERRAREQALRESERRNRTLVDNFPNGVVALFDEDLRHTLAGGEAFEVLDLSIDEVEGKTIREIFPDHLADEIEPHFRAVFDGETREFEVEAGGSIRKFRTRPVRDRDGRIVAGLGMSQEVTERKRRERELERYAGIIDAVGEPIYELDARGRFTFVNEPFVEQSGYTEEELLGEHVSIGMDEAAIERVESQIAAHYAEGEEGSLTLEYEVVTKDGERLPTENRLSLLTDEDGRFRGTVGVLWDVSERKARERELEESERRYRTLVENFPNGAVILFDDDLRYLTLGGEVFDGLDFSVDEVEGDTMEEHLPRELLDALEPRYRAVFDGEASEFEVEFNGQVRRLHVFPVYDQDGAVFAGMTMSQDVTRQREHEREMERQREQLAALNHLNEVFREITDAVIEQSTREEIEAIVCDRLAASDSYRFAWIGGVDMDTQTVTPRAEAGVEGYLDEITVSVDPSNELSQGPGGRAVLNKELATARDLGNESGFEPWRDAAREYGFRSSVAIPIAHEGTLYGVLSVYAERPDAFTDDELEVIGQLGEVVGHAIAAVERKRALTSDEVVELGFRVDGAFDVLDEPAPSTGAITITRAIPVGEGRFLAYGTADGDAFASLEAFVDEPDLPAWASVTVLDVDADETRFRAELVDPPVLSTVTARGGYVDELRIEGGDYYIRLHLAATADVRAVVEAIGAVYPSVELASHRQLSRERPSTAALRGDVFEELTERQRSAVEAAYYAGYFATPRESTGGEVAASLGVTPPTFHHHLRKAQQTVLGALLDRGVRTVS